MPQTLPDNPAIHFIDQVIVPNFNPANAVGYDPSVTNPSNDAFIPIAESFEETNPPYPFVYVQNGGSESTPGDSGYSFVSNGGPGQNRNGTLTIQIHAEDTQDNSGYTGDSGTYSAISADKLVEEIRKEIERLTTANATGGNSDFEVISSFRNEVPDESTDSTVVRKSGCSITYSWLREP